MTISEAQLIEAALEVRKKAYAPYSNYLVGAAIAAGGEVYSGANIENAAYWGGICAERTAMSNAVLAGHRRFDLIAVATEAEPPGTPCGVCRQILSEFAGPENKLRMILVNPKGDRREFLLSELFPEAYSREALPESQ